MSSLMKRTILKVNTCSRAISICGKLQQVIDQHGAAKIPYVSIATCVNMAGGQPISIQNLREVRELCNKYQIKIIHDATRVAENAYFIKVREPGFADRTIVEIVREICSYTDGCTMSAKKDAMVNIGGFLAINDWDIFETARNMVVIYEGLHTYGGMAGRDMEAVAIGIKESVQFDHIRARVGQVEYLGEKLTDWGIPIIEPIGGHAVFLDAKAFLPHFARSFPAQTLAAELYLEAGIRSMERGIVSAGRNTQTGDHQCPKLELVRLTLPRRVYTQAHMDVTGEAVLEVFDRRDRSRA